MNKSVYLIFTCLIWSCAKGGPPKNRVETGEAEPSQEKVNNDNDDDTADIPVEVAGAFLTSVEPASNSGAEDKTAGAGQLIGIDILNAIDLQKVTDLVQITEISFSANGETKTILPQPKSGIVSIFHAEFSLEGSVPLPLIDLNVKVSISESATLTLAKTIDQLNPEEKDAPSKIEPTTSPQVEAPLQNVTEHQLFVSNGIYQPGRDFLSIRDANALCNREARNAPELNRFWWKAVLADNALSIDQRQTLYGPVKNLDGQLLFSADNFSGVQLTAGLMQFANFGAIGGRTNDLVFTGIRKDGSTGDTCNSWSTGTGQATVGDPTSSGDWLDGSGVECGKAFRLYCISNKIRKEQQNLTDEQ